MDGSGTKTISLALYASEAAVYNNLDQIKKVVL